MKNKIFCKGFTLIELLVVIAVIGILAGGIVSIINPTAQIKKANDAKRKSDLSQIQKALEAYYQDNGSYPLSDAASTPKYEIKTAATTIKWGDQWAPYMSTLPADPSSSRNYVYYSDGKTYYLFASLENLSDPQTCVTDENNTCAANSNNPNGCKRFCNYGVSSPDVSVFKTASKSVVIPIFKQSPCPPYGDVNGDGSVSLDDAQMVIDFVIHKISLDDLKKTNGDVNGNVVINGNGVQPDINDYAAILNYVNSRITTFPICSQ